MSSESELTKAWDAAHAAREWGRWPCEHLVRYVALTFGDVPRAARNKLTALDLGCGAGAQARFLAGEGFRTYGIDCSAAALHRAIDIETPWACDFPPSYHLGDVRRLLVLRRYGVGSVDLFVDICSLQSLPTIEDLDAAYTSIRGVAAPGARLFAMMAAPGMDYDPGAPVRERLITEQEIKQSIGRHFDVEINRAGYTRRDRTGVRRAVIHWLIEGVLK